MSDLATFFATDPLEYTKEGGELKAIVEEMRKRRAQFNLGNMKAGNMKPVSAEKQQVLSIADKIGGLDL